jgi:hypothetical protein
MTPLQAAVAVVQKNLRPAIAADTHPMLADLLQRCWQKDPALRPTFAEIVDILNSIKEVRSTQRSTCILSGFFLILCSFIARWFGVLGITRDIQVDLTLGGDEAVDAAVLFSVPRLCFVALSHFSSLIDSGDF